MNNRLIFSVFSVCLSGMLLPFNSLANDSDSWLLTADPNLSNHQSLQVFPITGGQTHCGPGGCTITPGASQAIYKSNPTVGIQLNTSGLYCNSNNVCDQPCVQYNAKTKTMTDCISDGHGVPKQWKMTAKGDENAGVIIGGSAPDPDDCAKKRLFDHCEQKPHSTGPAYFPQPLQAKPTDTQRYVKIVNQCSYPLIIRNNFTNTPLDSGKSLYYAYDPSKDTNTRYFASAGCQASKNSEGQTIYTHCKIGTSEVNGGADYDTIFEVDWPAIGQRDYFKPDLNAVNGYTFPMKFSYTKKNNSGAATIDCGMISLKDCPATFTSEKTGKTFNERITIGNETTACIRPTFTINDSASPDYFYYSCPNITADQCKQNYHMTVNDNNPTQDDLVTAQTPAYVKYLHKFQHPSSGPSCHIYGFSYDENIANGGPAPNDGDPNHPITVTICPNPNNIPALPK